MLSQDSFKELDSKAQSEVITSDAEAKLLDETTEANSDHKTQEGQTPLISLLLVVIKSFRSVDADREDEDIL